MAVLDDLERQGHLQTQTVQMESIPIIKRYLVLVARTKIARPITCIKIRLVEKRLE